jgi:GntR family transcriptional regulator
VDAEPTPIRRPRADQARLVADVLRHQIHAGGYPDGLPSEADLATEFFVSRNAVREALATLKDEGLIDRGPARARTWRSASTTTDSTRSSG